MKQYMLGKKVPRIRKILPNSSTTNPFRAAAPTRRPRNLHDMIIAV